MSEKSAKKYFMTQFVSFWGLFYMLFYPSFVYEALIFHPLPLFDTPTAWLFYVPQFELCMFLWENKLCFVKIMVVHEKYLLLGLPCWNHQL